MLCVCAFQIAVTFTRGESAIKPDKLTAFKAAESTNALLSSFLDEDVARKAAPVRSAKRTRHSASSRETRRERDRERER